MYEQLAVAISSPTFSVQSKNQLDDLIKSLSENEEIILSGSPKAITSKGDPITILSFALGVTVATVPIIVQKILDWQSNLRISELQIEIQKDGHKVTATIQLKDIDKQSDRVKLLVSQIEDVLGA